MNSPVDSNETLPDLSGSYDNFLQIWKERTEEELHRDPRGFAHEHIHIKMMKQKGQGNTYELSFYKGRNNAEFLNKKIVSFDVARSDSSNSANFQLVKIKDEWRSTDGTFAISAEDNSISITGMGIYKDQLEEPYRLLKCRYFSGFIEYPLPDDPHTVHRLGDLETHDQGGMVALDYKGVDYTIELTQLVFAHKIKLMKVAIYNLPLNEVNINSKAISYTWSSPESKRLGINIRKLISGWTYIEDGFLSSNNMDVKSNNS